MKKNQPAPSPTSSIKELIELYERAATQATTLENLNTGIQRQEDEASLSSPQEFFYPMVAPQRTTSALSEEQMVSILPYNGLVKVYREEVKKLCHTVYGNADALQEKLAELLKNPALGEDFSWQLAKHPESVCKFAGLKICGIKNNTRRQAEESVTSLCIVVDGYIEAVKYARESLLKTPEAELKSYEQSMGSETIAQILQKSYHSKKDRGDLLKDEIVERVQQNSAIQRYEAQITYWCQVVFGQSNVLQEKMGELFKDPTRGEELSYQLAADPKSFHKLAGFSCCGFKNTARIHAEAGLLHLIDAVQNYADSIKQVKENLLQTHQAQHKQHESSDKLGRNLQRQHSLATSSKPTEHASAKVHQETVETSRQENRRSQDIQPRKVALPKAMALAS